RLQIHPRQLPAVGAAREQVALLHRLQHRPQGQAVAGADEVDRRPHQRQPHHLPLHQQRRQLVGAEAAQARPQGVVGRLGRLRLQPHQVVDDVDRRHRPALQEELTGQQGPVQRPGLQHGRVLGGSHAKELAAAVCQRYVSYVMKRSERLFALAEHLRGRRTGVTAEALAERFGVTIRTIYRDLDTLRAADLPLTAERGRGGGYALDKSYTLPPVNFTAREAALVIALGKFAIDMRLLPFSETLQSALDKVRAALSTSAQRELLTRISELSFH